MLMATETATWTVAQRDRLPNDGNKYETDVIEGGHNVVVPDVAVTVVRAGRADERVTDVLRWYPAGASRALEIDVATLLR
jgi:hypothetical protein